ncbi:MAG: hypothetical protein LJE89_12875 [Deltaproteobacteria bacterium]|nr:hypothetical protein [Deltaproteobacteria bacterium]
MAEVCWKDIIWTGANRELGIKEVLTILKGYGPLEVLHFENPSKYKGELSVWLDEEGFKHVSLFHLEVFGEKRRGLGREFLKCLKEIFSGDVFVMDPGQAIMEDKIAGGIHVEGANRESAMFWIRMFEEDLVHSVEGDIMELDQNTSPEELEILKQKILSMANE